MLLGSPTSLQTRWIYKTIQFNWNIYFSVSFFLYSLSLFCPVRSFFTQRKYIHKTLDTKIEWVNNLIKRTNRHFKEGIQTNNWDKPNAYAFCVFGLFFFLHSFSWAKWRDRKCERIWIINKKNKKNSMSTHLWYCVCKKLNSSLIRSQFSRMVNLYGWFGCGGPCKIHERKNARVWLKVERKWEERCFFRFDLA